MDDFRISNDDTYFFWFTCHVKICQHEIFTRTVGYLHDNMEYKRILHVFAIVSIYLACSGENMPPDKYIYK